MAEGWDLAYIGEKGYEYFAACAKDIIKHRSYSVSPRARKPDPFADEIPVAYIVSEEKYKPTARAKNNTR